MIIDEIKKFIEKCPYVTGKRIKVNNLGEKPVSMSIEQVPASPVIKKYTDGGTMRQMQFVLASREEYDEETWKQLKVSEFYENLQDWFEEQNQKKQLPDLGEGKTALGIEVLSGVYLMSSTERQARYQIQCRLVYLREGR